MNILITGANGYIGQRLIPVLLENNHKLFCCVRNKRRFEENNLHENIEVIEADLLNEPDNIHFPVDIDVAYFLVHSMTTKGDFKERESLTAKNFLQAIEKTNCRQVIYLSGIVNDDHLSDHLESRLLVENILNAGKIPLTTLRAGIIVGSGSASFEIIRDLVEKLPVMIAPKWLNTLCQPIAIRNVIHFLYGVMLKPKYFGKHFDIGGPDVLSYKQMLQQFAEVRKLKRYIFIVPVMTPRLSSYWLYFVTSTSYSLAINLVDSMKINVVATPNDLAQELQISLIPYKKAVSLAFEKIEQNLVLSSWKDSFTASNTPLEFMNFIEVPVYGCFQDRKWRPLKGEASKVMQNIWSIGGAKGWYYGNYLWKVRGLMDKFFGGVGLRRGRRSAMDVYAGDALDFWRVLIADKENKRLLLFAEMKLPGEAWLEFKIMKKDNQLQLRQTATFRPKGIWGRMYWYAMLPFHYFIFNGMIKNIIKTGI
ncbi:MAG: SDR family oxidoreductase [Bacteroidota bacterium]